MAKVLGGSRLRYHEPLSRHTTFRLGGPADLFYEAKTRDEAALALKLAKANGMPYLILGGGSNLLVADSGFRGLVIKMSLTGIEVLEKNDVSVSIRVMAGHTLGDLVSWAAEHGYTGLEFAAGIPGSFGGAVRGNAGAWLQAINKLLTRVEILNDKGEIEWIKPDDCGFDYRTSRFKKSGEVILSAELVLTPGDQAAIKAQIKENLQKRSTQPTDPSAGCVFVNPKPQAAGQLVDLCSLKGVKCGGAEISPQHANFVVNHGKATAQEVYCLIQKMKENVKEKFGIDLVEEIQLVGFENADKQEYKRIKTNLN